VATLGRTQHFIAPVMMPWSWLWQASTALFPSIYLNFSQS